jgi:hypothetical protein
VRFVLALLVMLWSHTAIAKPSLKFAAREGRVTVFAEDGLEDTAQQLANSAEATLTRIAGDLIGMPTPGDIEVRLVRDAADLASIAPADRGAPSWAIGVAYPDLGVISVAMRRGTNWTDPGPTMRHELAHIALGVALGPRAPHWLHEGFAYQHSAEWSWDRAETLAGMAWFGSTIPIEQLDSAFPAQESPAHRAYAQSYDFVGFLSRRGRWEDKEDDGDRWPFRKFLGELGNGVDIDVAARRSYGATIKQLFEEWKGDFAKRYKLVPIGLFGLAMWILCALLLVAAYFRRRHQNKKRVAQWDREDVARREAASLVNVPPYVPWPDGKDPFEGPADDDPDEQPPGPRLMN